MSAAPRLPAEIAQDLRKVMRGVAATVTIVTSEHEGVPYGMTATSFTSMTLDPPAVLVAINRDASVHDPLLKRGAFTVNVLAEGTEDVASHFGNSKLTNEERFRHGRWLTHASGLPVLENAQAWMVCHLLHKLEVGTHTLMVGRVEDIGMAPRNAPLLYADGRYHRLVTTG
ncbi:MAG: flavin reductase family protein [Geminicoccaceae bacterium]